MQDIRAYFHPKINIDLTNKNLCNCIIFYYTGKKFILYFAFKELFMRRTIKKITSVILAAVVFVASLSCSVSAFSYPEGTDESAALTAVGATDKLISAASEGLAGKSLKELVLPTLYSSETLSSLLVGVYSSIGDSSSEIESIGINVSVKSVAEGLSNYPEVKAALLKFSSWSDVRLDGVNWGVSDREGFANAVSASLAPFNDILYTLLCSGTFKIKVIRIKGANGYENAVVPMLSSLGCDSSVSQSEFAKQASSDKSKMLYNILMPLLLKIEDICNAPSSELCAVLPCFANFVESGEFKKCIDSLFSPITSNRLVEAAAFLKLFDLESFDIDIEKTLNDGLNEAAKQYGLTLKEIRLSHLAECGGKTPADSNKGEAYVVILRWLLDNLKLNKEKLPSLLKEQSSSVEISDEMLNGLLSKDTDELVSLVISLFSPKTVQSAKAMSFPEIKKTEVSYTKNLTAENYEKVLENIDGVLDEFVEEGKTYKSVKSMLSYTVYTNENINKLVVSLYSELEKAGLCEILGVAGIDVSPKGVAALLKESGYKNVKNALSKSDSWQKASLNNVGWGFYDGNRTGFQSALTASLRPLFPILRMLLAGEDLVLLDSIKIKGADGYNTAIIPMLEAFGCESADIKTYKQYTKNASTDGVLKAVLDPIFDLLDEIFEKPVYTLTGILPNIMYFIDSGNFETCLNNLLLPLSSLMSAFGDGAGLDVSSLTKELDFNSLLSSFMSGSDIKLPEFDFKSFSTYGTLEPHTSKSIVGGTPVRFSYVKADKTAVLITFLRVFVDFLKTPGNETLLTGAMGNGSAMSQYSSSITDELKNMTTDETIEWLFNLLFKERAQKELKNGEEYSPTIIYEKGPDKMLYVKIGIAVGVILIAAGIALFINRKRIFSADAVSVR